MTTRLTRRDEPIEACLTLNTDADSSVSFRVAGKTLADIERQWPEVMKSAARILAKAEAANEEEQPLFPLDGEPPPEREPEP